MNEEFLEGFADGTGILAFGYEGGAAEMWDTQACDLRAVERQRIEAGGYESGVQEGKNAAELFRQRRMM